MSMLKDADGDRPADAMAPGAGPDGKVKAFTPEEAAKLVGERDADEQAFADLLGGIDEDGEIDLESMSIEDLDELIAGLEG